MHFHVGHNMPGCLPNDAPYCTDSAEHAMSVWRDDLRNHLDGLADDGAFLDADTRLHLIAVSALKTNGSVSLDVENERYWVESAEGSTDDCELWEDA